MTNEQFLKLFEETCQTLTETVKKKNKDYSGQADPFKNFKAVELLGIANVEQGFLTRILDKVMRAKNLMQSGKNEVADEKISDTLLDLAGYAILFKIYTESKNREKYEIYGE